MRDSRLAKEWDHWGDEDQKGVQVLSDQVDTVYFGVRVSRLGKEGVEVLEG